MSCECRFLWDFLYDLIHLFFIVDFIRQVCHSCFSQKYMKFIVSWLKYVNCIAPEASTPFFHSTALIILSHTFPVHFLFSAISRFISYCSAEKSQLLICCQLSEPLQKHIIYSFQPFTLENFSLWLKRLCKTAAFHYTCKIT